MDFTCRAVHPEELAKACVEAEKLFRLINEGRVPDSIVAWMVATRCLLLLRTIYGGSSYDVARSILNREAERLDGTQTRNAEGNR